MGEGPGWSVGNPIPLYWELVRWGAWEPMGWKERFSGAICHVLTVRRKREDERVFSARTSQYSPTDALSPQGNTEPLEMEVEPVDSVSPDCVLRTFQLWEPRLSRCVSMSQLSSVCVTGHRKHSIYSIEIEESQHRRNKNRISTPQTIFRPPGQSNYFGEKLFVGYFLFLFFFCCWVFFNTLMVSLSFCDLYLFWPALFGLWNEDPSCVGFVFLLSNVEP